MSSVGIVCGRSYRSKAGEVRTVVKIATNAELGRAGVPHRKRIFWRDAAGVETSCRLDKFMRWRDKWGAVVVESEASK